MSTQGAVSRARVQRRTLTPPEARLWACLRARQLGGLKFRRQHPVGPYVLDFYCAEAKLAVEVDGQQHGDPDRAAHDRHRTGWLATQGIAVLRIAAEDVRVNLNGILTWIRTNAEERVRGQEPLHRFAVPLPIAKRRRGGDADRSVSSPCEAWGGGGELFAS